MRSRRPSAGRRRRALLAAGAALLVALAAFPRAAGAAVVEGDRVATSFDGTKIVYTLFLPDEASASEPVPAVMMTHGWGGSRQTSPGGFVQQLLDNGYAVLSWDSRGFGESGGQVEIDSPDFEARDASALVDVLAADPRIARTRPGDPRVGMSGGSYAGGIQWITAAADRRIDAIAPEISWHNLPQSLFPEGVIKTGWDVLLYAAGQTSVTGGLSPDNPAGLQTGSFNPAIHQALVEGAATGNVSAATHDFFAHRGPDYLLDSIRAPTFIIQGTIDTLFPPSQGVANYQAMKAKRPRVPLKMAFYCSGHGSCAPFNAGPSGYIQGQIVKWFDRFVKRDNDVDTGPRFEYVTNDGVWHGARDFPVPRTVTRTGSGSGTVVINGGPTITGLLQGSDAPASLEIPIPSGPGTLIGTPTVRLTESGLGTATDQPNKATLFFQIVDKADGEVVGNQITPKVLATDGASHTYTFPIEPVAYTVEPGDKLVLQVVSTSAAYEPYRGAALVNLKKVGVDVPALP